MLLISPRLLLGYKPGSDWVAQPSSPHEGAKKVDSTIASFGLASLRHVTNALSGWRAASAPTDGLPHLERLPCDLSWHAAGYLTARELLRCGEANSAHAEVCLRSPQPWDALRRRSSRAAGVTLIPRKDEDEPPARLFFADARSMPGRVAAEAAEDPCVLVVDGRAYELTAFLDQHPGGGELLTEFAGKDASLAFAEVGHSFYARSMLDAYEVDAACVERFVGGSLTRQQNRPARDERKTLLRYGFAQNRMRGTDR